MQTNKHKNFKNKTTGWRAALAPALLAALWLAAPAAQAQATAANLPSQTIKLIVGYAPGGPVDTSARQFAPHFARELGATVIVENRPGAAGAIGGDAVAKSAPAGINNTLLLFYAASPTVTISPHLLKSMPFDPVKDITPIAPILAYANVLVVNKDAPFKTLPQLVSYAKANPGQVTYGSAGIGASNHLSGELLALRTGTLMNHVPYRGSAPAMADVVGGQTHMMFDIPITARGFISGGRVLPIAVTSRERNASLPQVPTLTELGVADYDVAGWFALFGPAKMPPELVAKFNDATRKVLATEEFRAKLVEQGFDVWADSPQALGARVVKELALWGPVTKGIPQQ